MKNGRTLGFRQLQPAAASLPAGGPAQARRRRITARIAATAAVMRDAAADSDQCPELNPCLFQETSYTGPTKSFREGDNHETPALLPTP
jgi:hypothetical protein